MPVIVGRRPTAVKHEISMRGISILDEQRF
jgi:hypothetical protein